MAVRLAVLAAILISGCAARTTADGSMYDRIVFTPVVDPASVRDPARYEQDRAECKRLAQGTFGASMEQESVMFSRCLTGRGYSVLSR